MKLKQLGVDDPLLKVGIMSLNNECLPYKRPILKQHTAYNYNTRSVLDELAAREQHGGLKGLVNRQSSNSSRVKGVVLPRLRRGSKSVQGEQERYKRL